MWNWRYHVLQAPANIKHQHLIIDNSTNSTQVGGPMGCDKDMIVLQMKCVHVCVHLNNSNHTILLSDACFFILLCFLSLLITLFQSYKIYHLVAFIFIGYYAIIKYVVDLNDRRRMINELQENSATWFDIQYTHYTHTHRDALNMHVTQPNYFPNTYHMNTFEHSQWLFSVMWQWITIRCALPCLVGWSCDGETASNKRRA